MKALKYELSLFTVLLLAVLAPISRLIKYNSEYFTLSGVEYLISALIVALLAYGLTLITRFFLSKVVLLNAARVLLVVSVISVFFIPINLDAIDGGDALAFMVRKESLIALTIAFTVFVLYSIFLKGRFDKQIKLLSTFSAVYVLAFLGYATYGLESYVGYTGVSGDYKLPLSSKQNVFVVSFDQIQGTAFKGLIEEDESVNKVFKDFTFYTDTASTYPNTNYSLSSVLLGRRAANAAENFNAIMASDSGFLVDAENAGAKVYTGRYGANKKYTCLTCANGSKKYNSEKSYELLRHATNISFGLDFGFLAKYLPASFKKELFGDTSIHAWKHDMHDFEELVSKAYIESSQTSVYFLHFLATHQPFTYDANCQIMNDAEIKKHQNPTGALLQMQCLSKQMDAFVDTLKSHNVYQDSLIILYSDHGYEKNINDFSRDLSNSSYFTETSGYVGSEGNIKPAGAYNPIFLIKYPNKQNEMLEHSSLPASLIDIAPTVCATLQCKKNDWQGFDLAKEKLENRTRDFWLYLGGSDMRASDGSSKLHGGLDTYWEVRKFDGSIFPNIAYAMGMDESYIRPSLALDESMFFGQKGQSDNYVAGGWFSKEQEHRWTAGSLASLKFSLLGALDSKLQMRLHANAFLPANKKSQTVKVLVNDNHLTTWQMNKLGWYEADIPQGLINESGEVRVQFEIAEPTAPCDVSDSTDCINKLGLAAREFVITEYKNDASSEVAPTTIAPPSTKAAQPVIKLGQSVDFSAKGTSEPYVLDGWSAQEGTHRWTEGSAARLQLPVEPPAAALRLKLLGNGFAPKGQTHQLVNVVVNGKPVAEWQVADLAWYDALIPADVAALAQPMQVEFVIDKPTAPCDVSESTDCRKLGLAVRELIIERQ